MKAVMNTFSLPIFCTIQSDTYKNGIETTAPVVIVSPNKYIGAPIVSFKYTNKKVSTKPKQFPKTNMTAKKKQMFKSVNILLTPFKPDDLGKSTSILIKQTEIMQMSRNISWPKNGT